MKLTIEETDVLAHVVVDPQMWLDHAVNTFGEARAQKMLADKIKRWKPEYEAQKDSFDYKNRVERDAIELEERKKLGLA